MIIRYLPLMFLTTWAYRQPIDTEKIENVRPNLLIFCVDDLGYGDIEVYGANGMRTAILDAALLIESFTLAIRQGDWKYIRPFIGSISVGIAKRNIELGLLPDVQLFNEPVENSNLQASMLKWYSRIN